jgi:hypothetical protein
MNSMKCSMVSKCNLSRFLIYILNVNVEKRLFLKLNFFRTTFLAYFVMLRPYMQLVMWHINDFMTLGIFIDLNYNCRL